MHDRRPGDEWLRNGNIIATSEVQVAEKTINWVKNLGTCLAVCAVVGVAAPGNLWAGQWDWESN